MRAKKRFLITVAAAVLIIALIGAAAAITVSVVGKGTSYAFWSESHDVMSTEVSDTTALAKEINPSEKYIEYEYYVIDGGKWDPTKEWTRKIPEETPEADGDNIMRPKFDLTKADNADITADDDKTTNIKAVVSKYTGNISTLNIPDTTPVWVGGVLCNAEVVEIASLNMETSPGVAIVDKLIIGRNVKAIGYARGTNGGVISSGMYGFYALNDVLIVRTGSGTAHANGYFTQFDKITAVGHFFEDSPNVKSLNVLVYSNYNTENDAVPLKRAVERISDVFQSQSADKTPSNFVDTGIDADHGRTSGFKLSTTAIGESHDNGITIYKDLLHSEKVGVLKYDGGFYNMTIGEGTDAKTYRLKRTDTNEGVVYVDGNADKAVGRYNYASYTITVTLYEIGEDGAVVTDGEDDAKVPRTAAKYFY